MECLGGLIWILVSQFNKVSWVSLDNLFFGLLIGGIVGAGLHCYLAFKIGNLDKNYFFIFSGILGGITGGISSMMADRIVGIIFSMFYGGFGGLMVGITSLICVGIVDIIAGKIDGGIDFKSVGKIVGETVAMTATVITGLTIGLFASDIIYPPKLSLHIGVIFELVIVVVELLYILIGGCIGGLVVGMIGVPIIMVAFGIPLLISLPITSFISPLLIILSPHRKVFCINCFRYSLPLKSRYDKGIRYCEHCNSSRVSDRSLLSMKIIGVIGGDIEDYRIDKDKVYVNLWFEDKKEPRNADIDVLEIRNSSRKIRYAMAIESVYHTLYNDKSRPKDWIKKIPVFIDAGLNLPVNTIDFLENKFGGIKGKINE